MRSFDHGSTDSFVTAPRVALAESKAMAHAQVETRYRAAGLKRKERCKPSHCEKMAVALSNRQRGALDLDLQSIQNHGLKTPSKGYIYIYV